MQSRVALAHLSTRRECPSKSWRESVQMVRRGTVQYWNAGLINHHGNTTASPWQHYCITMATSKDMRTVWVMSGTCYFQTIGHWTRYDSSLWQSRAVKQLFKPLCAFRSSITGGSFKCCVFSFASSYTCSTSVPTPVRRTSLPWHKWWNDDNYKGGVTLHWSVLPQTEVTCMYCV